MDHEDLPLRFFRAVADETRLRLLGLLALRDHTPAELAAATGEREPAVSRHLARLAELGLVAVAADGPPRRYRLDLDALQGLKRAALARERPAGPPDAAPEPALVLRHFFDGERLKGIPADRKKRDLVLDWLADRFEPDVRYPEQEVNALIKRHHPDSAALRRELVDGGWMARERGIYWRLPRGGGGE